MSEPPPELTRNSDFSLRSEFAHEQRRVSFLIRVDHRSADETRNRHWHHTSRLDRLNEMMTSRRDCMRSTLSYLSGAGINGETTFRDVSASSGPLRRYYVGVDTIDWLLDGDPAISWQAMRDLRDASRDAVAAERARVPREGAGAEILARQGSDGSWHRLDTPDWLPTLYSMLLLRATGVDRAEPAIDSAVARLAEGFRWDEEFGAKPFFEGEVEPCINGGTLALGAYFGRPADNLARRLVGEQLDDGGWNCEAPKSRRSSFHTTICVLEGLLEYERAVGSTAEIMAVRRRGEEYLLERGLFRRYSTGEVANPAFLNFAFPPRYHFDVLRALDYFRDAGAQPDPRMEDALHIVMSRQQANGRWLLDRVHDEALPFSFGESEGEPSRWNTLRALRVIRWYERRRLEPASSP